MFGGVITEINGLGRREKQASKGDPDGWNRFGVDQGVKKGGQLRDWDILKLRFLILFQFLLALNLDNMYQTNNEVLKME